MDQGGADKLYGGAGEDAFVFNTIGAAGNGANRDRIYDFKRGDDVIDLTGIDADSGKNGNQTFDFVGSKAFSGEAGELRFSAGRVSGDVNGDGKADFSISVVDVATLKEGDFLL